MYRATGAVLAAAAFLTVAPLELHAQQCPDGRPAPFCAPRMAADTNTLAILPFNVSGPPGSEYVGEVVMDLLQMALDGRANIRVLYPAQVLRRVGPNAAGDPLAASRITRDMGAGRLIGGQVVVTGEALRLRMDVLDAVRGVRQFVVTAQGTLATLGPMIDSAASRMLANRLVPAAQRERRGIADYTTSDPEALRLLLVAEGLERKGDRRGTADTLKKVLRLDPDFGLAHLRMARNEGARGGISGQGYSYAEILANAWARADRFTPRVRALLDVTRAQAGSDRAQALAMGDALAREYPNDPDVLFRRADLYFHFGLNLGASRSQAITAMRAALAVDDANLELLSHFSLILLEADDTTSALDVERRCEALSPGYCGVVQFMDFTYRGVRPWVRPYSRSVQRSLPEVGWLRALPNDLARAVAMMDTAQLVVASNDTIARIRRDAHSMRMMAAYMQGRFESAWWLLDTVRLSVEMAPSPFADHIRLYHQITGLRRGAADSTMQLAAGGFTSHLSRAWYAVARLPAETQEAHLRMLDSVAPVDSVIARAARQGFRGMQALTRRDTADAIALLTQALRPNGRRQDGNRILWPANAFAFQLAELQYARGNFAGARRTLADLYPPFDALPFVAPGEELKAKVHLALGDTASARIALKNFIGLWDKADPPLQPRVAAARAMLARIDGR